MKREHRHFAAVPLQDGRLIYLGSATATVAASGSFSPMAAIDDRWRDDHHAPFQKPLGRAMAAEWRAEYLLREAGSLTGWKTGF